MQHYLFLATVSLAALLLGIAWGVAIVRYNVFPHQQVKAAIGAYKRFRNPSPPKVFGPFSIGIYEGDTPLDLAAPTTFANPILTARDVKDIDALFVADPFLLRHSDTWYMFFETLERETKRGVISYATSVDGRTWEYRKVVITEPFHLSYPHVFEWGGDHYLIPESHEDFSVRLYKARSFPDEWEYVGNLLSGYRYADPTVFRQDGKWWLFVSTGSNNILNLYVSDHLQSGWRPHPLNPIVKFDKHVSRPAGRVLQLDGQLYRFAQDCEPYYGIQVMAIRITKLSETEYAEDLEGARVVVTRSGSGWNASGMHHVDPHRNGARWLAAVDGQY